MPTVAMLGKFLTVDPGEDTGWSVWNGDDLIDAGTEKMWAFSDAVWAIAIWTNTGSVENWNALPTELKEVADVIAGPQVGSPRLEFMVVENWTLYPDVIRAGALDWDECRTARLIGSLYAACRVAGWQYEQQPALIKRRAEAAGAEAFFSHPLKENRHANDAIRHGVFRNARERGAPWTDLSQKEFEVAQT